MEFIDSKCLESLLIEGEEIANESCINKDYLSHASYSLPIYPYSDNEIPQEYEIKYKNLLKNLKIAVNKGAIKIKLISKKYKSLNIENFISKSFIDFEKSSEWKSITSILKSIQDIEAVNGGIELYETNVLNDWKLINTENYDDATLYDFSLVSCSQDDFFIYVDIISYLLDNACSNISKASANCFADDRAVFTVVIQK